MPDCGIHSDFGVLNQYLARLCKELVYLSLYLWIDHQRRTITIRAEKARCRAKEAADQRAFAVHLAPLIAKIRATEFGQCGLMFLIAFLRKPGDLFCSGGDRATAIVAPRFACKYWNMVPKKSDFLAIFSHRKALPRSVRLTTVEFYHAEL